MKSVIAVVALCLVALMSTMTVRAAADVNAATVLYMVNPVSVEPGKRSPIFPTCPPTMTSKGSGFMCYADTNNGTNAVQFISPAAPDQYYTKSIVTAPNEDRFSQQPIALSQVAALVAVSEATDSFWAMTSSLQIFHHHDRKGSTAAVTYSPKHMYGYIPIGQSPRVGPQDSLMAIDLAQEKDTIVWSQKFDLPAGFTGSTAMQDPVYYDGAVYVMQANTLYKLNATKAPAGVNQTIWAIEDPCGIKPAAGNFIKVQFVTFSADANGNLDALLLYANTTGPKNAGETSICRISHHDGHTEWPQVKSYNMDMEIHDVSAGHEVIFMSVRMTALSYQNSYEIVAFSAKTGAHLYVVPRSPIDRRSYPLVLQNPTKNCVSSFVAQVKGKLTAMCVLDGTVSWTSDYECNEKPASVITPPDNKGNLGEENVACTKLQNSVHLINLKDGTVRWSNAIETVYGASFVDGVVWVVDIDGWVWGLAPTQVAPTSPPATPSPTDSDTGGDGGKKGLTAGEIVLILFVFAFVVGIGGGVAFSWVKRSKRRGPYQAGLDSDGYGSLSS